MAFVYISIFHVKVVLATRRPWEGCKSGRKCGAVDENLSENGMCCRAESTKSLIVTPLGPKNNPGFKFAAGVMKSSKNQK